MATVNGNSGRKYKVALIGSGNWGSAIATIIGSNVSRQPDLFDSVIKMYVFEEMIEGKKLTEIINSSHENVKYLPGIKLPENIVADPDVVSTASDADILVIVIPHAFVPRTCEPLKGKLKEGAIAISLNKGFGKKGDTFVLISDVITDILKIPCSVLMGANLAGEVAKGDFCETTIGCRDAEQGRILKKLFHTENFLVTVVTDAYTVEICGALKNIVACAAGFVEGLAMGDNTKSAVMRLGAKEMIRFVRMFYPNGFNKDTFMESCGMADLITTCYGGRNRKVSKEFATRIAAGKTETTMAALETEMLNGQKLQGAETAHEVYDMLKERNLLEKFPLFVAVHLIATKQIPVQELIPRLRNQPEEE